MKTRQRNSFMRSRLLEIPTKKWNSIWKLLNNSSPMKKTISNNINLRPAKRYKIWKDSWRIFKESNNPHLWKNNPYSKRKSWTYKLRLNTSRKRTNPNTEIRNKKIRSASFSSESPMKDKEKNYKTVTSKKSKEPKKNMMKWSNNTRLNTDNK